MSQTRTGRVIRDVIPSQIMFPQQKIFTLFLALVLTGCTATSVEEAPTADIPPAPPLSALSQTELYYPIENFKEGITLKPFGIYITPRSSPVRPERFTGYHTGADVEVPEAQQDEDVWVYAVADGTVELSRSVSGYGGVLIISFAIAEESYSALYGHLRAPLNLKVGDKVVADQALAVLGEGFSVETDGERKHLHFALQKDGGLDLRGYVQTKEELDKWADPLEFFKSSRALHPAFTLN